MVTVLIVVMQRTDSGNSYTAHSTYLPSVVTPPQLTMKNSVMEDIQRALNQLKADAAAESGKNL